MYKSLSRRWNRHPPAGFRFSSTDAVAVIACIAATWGMRPILGEMAICFPVVLGHFFLFCNVFRIPRRPELLWSGVFLVNCGVWMSVDRFTWPAVLWTQLPMTLTVILWAVFHRDYHGVGYSWIPWGRRFGATPMEHASNESKPQDGAGF